MYHLFLDIYVKSDQRNVSGANEHPAYIET